MKRRQLTIVAAILLIANLLLVPQLASAQTPPKIVFASTRDGGCQPGGCNFEIYSMNGDGSGVTRLTNNPAFDSAPEWSPDGSKIAFTSDRYVTPSGIRVTGIYIMNADGSNVTAPTPPAGYYFPDWSSDGKKFVFHSMRDGAAVYPTHDVWVVNVDGSGLTRLTDPQRRLRRLRGVVAQRESDRVRERQEQQCWNLPDER